MHPSAYLTETLLRVQTFLPLVHCGHCKLGASCIGSASNKSRIDIYWPNFVFVCHGVAIQCGEIVLCCLSLPVWNVSPCLIALNTATCLLFSWFLLDFLLNRCLECQLQPVIWIFERWVSSFPIMPWFIFWLFFRFLNIYFLYPWLIFLIVFVFNAQHPANTHFPHSYLVQPCAKGLSKTSPKTPSGQGRFVAL